MLRHELAARKVDGADAAEAVAFYEEAIEDRLESGLDSDKALAELGNPAEAAERIAADAPALERARRTWPSWGFNLLVAALLATAVFWGPSFSWPSRCWLPTDGTSRTSLASRT